MTETPDILILGAGPTGLAAAIALGPRALVLEARPGLGGLTASVTLDGAVFDLGGHSFHTPHPEIRELVFGALPMFEQRRDARCYFAGDLIPYPFQKNFKGLRAAPVVAECEAGLTTAGDASGANNFQEFLERRFGAGIAKHYLLPLNRKQWGALDRLAVNWVSERVAAPKGECEQFARSGGQRTPLQSDTLVAYPAQGGFDEIARALARRVDNIRFGHQTTHIDPVRRELTTAAGKTFSWRRLISTLPLPELVRITANVPAELQQAAQRLESRSVRLVFAVIHKPIATEIQRVYCAEPFMPAHKIVFNHNSSDFLRALPHHGIQGEIAFPTNEPPPDTERKFVDGLARMGLIASAAELATVESRDYRHAYPVHTHERAGIVAALKAWFAGQGIHLAGARGEWAYISSDEALRRGLAAGRLCAAELEFREPMIANASLPV